MAPFKSRNKIISGTSQPHFVYIYMKQKPK